MKKVNYVIFFSKIESYREDYRDAQHFKSDPEEMLEFYFNMKSGAESGWDYSTKW